MDKKLLEALNNLSLALGEISDALKKDDKSKKSATTDALQGGNFINEIKQINVGIKALQKDTKEILKNQKTIIELSKKKGGTKNEFEKAGGDKKQESSIKKGIGTILLIAVAVVAIGMAFKLVGGINFLSVIGLSIAMFVLAKTFERIAALNMSLKGSAVVALTMVMMAAAITVSSWIMSRIIPMSLAQLFTAVLIGVGFSAMAPAIGKILNTFSKMGVVGMIKAIVAFPLILPAIAMGITISSWILSTITPIGLMQALTGILISVMFTVIAYGLQEMLSAFSKIGIMGLSKSVIFLPLILPAIAMAITASSWILQEITPIGLMQAFTAILIALMFTVISFGLKAILRALNGANPLTALLIPLILPLVAKAIALSSEILSTVKPMGMDTFLTSLGISVLFIAFAITLKIIGKNLKNIHMEDVIILPALFTTLSLAIALSSAILDKTTDIKGDRLWSILKMGIVMSILTIASLPAYIMIKRLGLGIEDIAKGALLILGIATTIMLASHILAAGNYGDYPTAKWVMGVGLSILTFGGAIIGLGFLATTGLGLVAILSGIPLVLLVVGSIVAADKILSKGSYDKFPSLMWALSVSKVMRTFGTLVGLLGVMPKAWVSDGVNVVNMISKSIVSAAWLFKGASAAFTGGPTKEWAKGVGIAIGAFSPVYSMMMNSGILKLFGVSGVGPKDFAIAIRTISQGIVDAAKFFNSPEARAGFSTGPSKEWSEGVGKAIGAFSPVYRMLMNSGLLKLFGVSGVDPKNFTGAIRIVSQGIVDAAKFFNSPEAQAGFNTGPKKEWSEGVGLAIGAFAPVYKMLMDSSLINLIGGKGTTADDFGNAIRIVSRGIFDAAEIFNGKDGKNASFGGVYPTKEWSTGVGSALAAFAPVFSALSGKGWFESGKEAIDDMIYGIRKISYAIVSVGKIFAWSKVSWDPKTVPNKEWDSAVFSAFKTFSRIHYVVSISGIGGFVINRALNAARNMVNFAKALQKGAGAFSDPNTAPSAEWSSAIFSSLKSFSKMYYLASISGIGGYVINRAINAARNLVNFAKILQKGARAFSNMDTAPSKEWSFSVFSALKSFSRMHYIASISGIGRAGGYRTLNAARNMVNFAKELQKGARAFQVKIDPNFMKNMSSNLYYYMKFAEKLKETNSLSSLVKGAVFGDPITNIATSMTKLAIAYDRMATSLMKFNNAINSLDEKKINTFKGLNGNIIRKVTKEVGQTVNNSPMQSLNTPNLTTSGVNSLTSLSSLGDKRKEAPRKEARGKHGTAPEQFDKMIDLLYRLIGNSKYLDKYLNQKLGGPEGNNYN